MQYTKKLEYYFDANNEYASFNKVIYKELYEDLNISNLLAPLEFFNITRDEFLFFWHNNKDNKAIEDHFSNLDFAKPQLYYIFNYLSRLIKVQYAERDNGIFIINYPEPVLKSCAFIHDLFERVAKEFKPQEIEQRKPAITNLQFDTIPTPDEYLEISRKITKKQREALFPGLIKEYEKEKKASNLYTDEFDLVEDKIKIISDYIEGVDNKRLEYIREHNGLSYGLKPPHDFLYLPSYELYLKWLTERKRVLETPIGERSSNLSDDDKKTIKIKSKLSVFEAHMSEQDFNTLVFALKEYFEKDSFQPLDEKIIVSGKVNVKKFGWALNEIYRLLKPGKLDTGYLTFAKVNISLFNDVPFTEIDYRNTRLYKYFTTKTL